jgi:hypothetical protein
MSFPNRLRAPVAGAVTGIVVAAAVVGSSALASGGGAAASRPAAKTATAPGTDCSAPAPTPGAKHPDGSSAGPSPAPFLAAIAQLVQAGTINQHQADVLDADIRAGSIDPDQLVANGTLSSAQVQTVMERLGAVKRSLASDAGASGDLKAKASRNIKSAARK